MTDPDAGRWDAGDEGLVLMPAFDTGGRVERTGIALVHEGEHIVPAPGSAAVMGPAGEPMGTPRAVLTFPVEIEVVGELSGAQLDVVARHVFDELDVALRRHGG